jgi:hypothetical protein
VAFGVETGAGAAVVAFGVEVAAALVAFGVEVGALEVAPALVAPVEVSPSSGAAVFRVSDPAEVPPEAEPDVEPGVAPEPATPEAEPDETGAVENPLLISAARPA